MVGEERSRLRARPAKGGELWDGIPAGNSCRDVGLGADGRTQLWQDGSIPLFHGISGGSSRSRILPAPSMDGKCQEWLPIPGI